MRNYTKEQLEYRNSLHKKYKPKAIPEVKPKATHPRSFYMKNCIYWIEEFENGNVDVKQVYKSLKVLEKHTNEYLVEITKSPQDLF